MSTVVSDTTGVESGHEPGYCPLLSTVVPDTTGLKVDTGSAVAGYAALPSTGGSSCTTSGVSSVTNASQPAAPMARMASA